MSSHLAAAGYAAHCFERFDPALAAAAGEGYQYGSAHYVRATWHKVAIVKEVGRHT